MQSLICDLIPLAQGDQKKIMSVQTAWWVYFGSSKQDRSLLLSTGRTVVPNFCADCGGTGEKIISAKKKNANTDGGKTIYLLKSSSIRPKRFESISHL